MVRDRQQVAGPDAGRRVLIVDDDRDFAESLRDFLAPRGYTVEVADSARRALEIAAQFDAKVALLDVRLGRANGLDLLPALNRQRPDIVCTMITAHADIETAVEALRSGAYDYLRKPIHPDELVATLERSFEKLRLQQEKQAALSRLAGGIAHDFNNLLLPIIGLTELTMSGMSAKSQWRTNLEEVLEACDHATELVKQILTFSRDDKPDRHPIELHRIVSQALKLLRAALPTPIELREHIDKHSGTVLADATQIHQVVLNLGSNAAGAMGANGGVLEVMLSKVDVSDNLAAGHATLEPGRYVKLTVSDTGCGMDEETIARIFDSLFTTKGVGEGSGIGLSVVHGIVTSHGGAITVSSEPGRGTTFDIYFPLWEGNDETVLSAGEPAPEAHENQASKLVPQQQQR